MINVFEGFWRKKAKKNFYFKIAKSSIMVRSTEIKNRTQFFKKVHKLRIGSDVMEIWHHWPPEFYELHFFGGKCVE